MALSRKKVIVRFNDPATPTLQAGYLHVSGFLRHPEHTLELLDPAGRILTLETRSIRYIAYVHEFNLDDAKTPERLSRKTFLARPRAEGLWVRVTFLDGDVLEGLAPVDIPLLDDAITDRGLFLIPPDTRSNTQRLFIPRSSLLTLKVIALITTPSKTAARPSTPKAGDLPFPTLFPE